MAKKVVIIGAGVGGFATGLAVRGYQEEIFEKEALPGGKMNMVLPGSGISLRPGANYFNEP